MGSGAIGGDGVIALNRLSVKIFADGADRASMLELYARPYIRGLTTNPSLMRKAGIANYRAFAKDILSQITDKPVCFEVLADDFAEMERQALEIAGWADNVYVKIPVVNTKRESCRSLVERLARRQVRLNVTAIMTLDQVQGLTSALSPATACYVSIFAGRIADTGLDPIPIIATAVKLFRSHPKAEIVWASSREVLNIFQADIAGCHVITVTEDILRKLSLVGYDLTDYSVDTVKMFYDDARVAGFSL
jgi:transaldolase